MAHSSGACLIGLGVLRLLEKKAYELACLEFGARLSKAVRMTRLRDDVSGIGGGGGGGSGGRGAEEGPRLVRGEASGAAAGCCGILEAAVSSAGPSGAADDFVTGCCGNGALI